MNNSYSFSKSLSNIIMYSREEALRLNTGYIEPEHIMLGMIRDRANRALMLISRARVDIADLKGAIETRLREAMPRVTTNGREIGLSMKASNLLRLCVLESRLLHQPEAGPEHLLLAFLKQPDNAVAVLLRERGVFYDQVFALLRDQDAPAKSLDPIGAPFDEDDDPPFDVHPKQGETRKARGKESDTPAIDSYSVDLTLAARQGKLDPVVGREREIMRVAQILCRRKKNNPVLIGEPGVGKNAIVEGLAQRISQRQVPHTLLGKRLVTLDMAGMVAGTKYRGQFEERIQTVIAELKAHPEIIIFIDEIHTLVGAGNQAGQMDAANMMKPALARGELQCIGATTLDEYRQSIEKDGALERRFQKIIVEAPSPDETITILHNLKPRYEAHHHVCYTDAAIEACVRLTARYVSDRSFPDKAIDALDEAGASARIRSLASAPSSSSELAVKEAEITQLESEREQAVKDQAYEQAIRLSEQLRQLDQQLQVLRDHARQETSDEPSAEVDTEQVAETVATMTGIPLQRMAETEWARLKEMRNELRHQVIGQDDAIDKLASAIQRSRIGLSDPNRPIGTFLFLGPTGVGKTFMAKKLAEQLFGSADALIRIDMSEYMEKFAVSRLVGAPPGYVGYEEGGMLTERVRRKPYSIVLLDEVEKAHPDALNILLQVMDDGRLTDSLGRTIDFRNTVLIMTSNAGSKQLKDFGRGIGFGAADMAGADKGQQRAIVRKALDKLFTPEFLNRIDEIITFDPLSLESILSIVDNELKPLSQRLLALGYDLDITPEARHFLAEKGYDKQYGARPLRRAIQTHIEDALTLLIMNEGVQKGETIRVGVAEGEARIELLVLHEQFQLD